MYHLVEHNGVMKNFPQQKMRLKNFHGRKNALSWGSHSLLYKAVQRRAFLGEKNLSDLTTTWDDKVKKHLQADRLPTLYKHITLS